MTRHVKRLFRWARVSLFQGANGLVAPFEVAVAIEIADEVLTRWSPIIIVGAPRSGTTLLYQLVTAAFECGYLTNRTCYWYRAPALAERLFPTPFDTRRESYQSRLGKIAGRHGPSECGRFWYRFLPRYPHAISPDAVDPQELLALRHAVAALTRTIGAPLVFKNVVLSVRIPLLAQAIPEARFMVVHRKEDDTVASIVRAREASPDGVDQWFSVRPKEYETLMTIDSTREQAVSQVRAIYAAIDEARETIGHRRFVDVHYEDVCDDPAAAVQRLELTLRDLGASIERRPDFEYPALTVLHGNDP